MFLSLFFLFLVIQRLLELYIAKRNATYIQSLGGFEVGKSHYPFIVALHAGFLVSVFLESKYIHSFTLQTYWIVPFVLFMFTQGLRFWIIITLGRFWNTRIFVLPNAKPLKKGPYRYLRHPNYLIVMLEMITVPLIFGAYMTAVIFPILNAIMLTIRINIEEKALSVHMKYDKEMAETPRFIPLWLFGRKS